MHGEVTPSREGSISILRRVDLFQGLPEEDLRRIASIVRERSVERNEVLFEEGGSCQGLFVVRRGSVEIVKEERGGAIEEMAVRRPGEAFGEIALLDETPSPVGARTREPSRLLVVERDDFRRLLGEDTLALRMLRILSRAPGALDVRSRAEKRLEDTAGASEMGRILQQGILPRNAPKVEGYELAAGTSTEEGGEGRSVWDHLERADGRFGLVSLHVRGDGIPPSYLLGIARALLRDPSRRGRRPRGLVGEVNEALADAAIEGVDQFVDTAVVVPSGGEVLWTGAGRSPGAILRRDGEFEELPSHGPPLGMMGGFRYGEERIAMKTGDVFLSLSEAPKGLFRGAADLVSTLHGKPPGEVVRTVHRALRKARAQAGEPPESSVLYLRKK